ncbi:hypothetical protein TEA_029675 [Camellia sinensis var. sinensis]|uniref:BHLH domain-containing protein n=1 Tax=Camellia sinensis var. sinensis TaxID=542762 RepID=A0A4S4EGI8_CAMSN|nr:hypothetical protein TEA_029675 [Camellia sinensis var. sinensis]
MDFVSSMFPFDQIDDFLEFSSIPCQQLTIQQDTELLVKPSLCNYDVTNKPEFSEGRKSSVAFDDIDDNPCDHKRRKIIHRDVERQRRQEMAALYRLLRSLLPLDYLKKRNDVLREKRDELKRSSLNQSSVNGGSKYLPSCLKQSVTVVETSRGGVQVVVNTALIGRVSVSRVLDVLIREGLTVISCISTNINERSLHSIETEVFNACWIGETNWSEKIAWWLLLYIGKHCLSC